MFLTWTKKDPSSDDKNKDKVPNSDRITRSQVEKFDKHLCFFCQSEDTSNLNNMSSFDIDTRVRAAIQEDQELNIRYNAAFDARAGDLKYHRYCIKSHVYTPISLEVDNSLKMKALLDAGFFLNIETSLQDGSVMSLAETVNEYDNI